MRSRDRPFIWGPWAQGWTVAGGGRGPATEGLWRLPFSYKGMLTPCATHPGCTNTSHNFIIAVSQSFILFTSETLSSLSDGRQVKGAFVVCTWNNLGGDRSVSYISLKPLNLKFWGHCDVGWAESRASNRGWKLFFLNGKIHRSSSWTALLVKE